MNPRIETYLAAKRKHLALGIKMGQAMIAERRDMALSIQHDFAAVEMVKAFNDLTTEDQDYLVNFDGDRSEKYEEEIKTWLERYGLLRYELSELLHRLGLVDKRHARKLGPDADQLDVQMLGAEFDRVKKAVLRSKQELSWYEDPDSTEHSCFIQASVRHAFNILDALQLKDEESLDVPVKV